MTTILVLRKKIYCNIFRCKLSYKQKIFSKFFAFSKFRLNLEHFWKKEQPHSWYIFEFMDSEKRG